MRLSLRIAVVLSSLIAALAATTATAAATKIQQYSGGWANLPSGTSIGTPSGSTLSTPATMQMPSGTVSCTKGGFAGTMGTNPASSVALTPTQLSLTSCTDSVAMCDVQSMSLETSGSASMTFTSGATHGTITLTGSTFKLACKLPNGTTIICSVRPVDSGGSNVATGQLVNPGSTPPGPDGKVRFATLRVQSVTGGACATLIGALGSTNSTYVDQEFNAWQVLGGAPPATIGSFIRGLFGL